MTLKLFIASPKKIIDIWSLELLQSGSKVILDLFVKLRTCESNNTSPHNSEADILIGEGRHHSR
jgi:hypothetical protein